jgi:hypothetical protein
MRSFTQNLKLERPVLLSLLAYLTVHLLEEGIFGFPAGAELRWGIPNYTLPANGPCTTPISPSS